MTRDEWRAQLAEIAANPDESGRVRLDALETLGRDKGWIHRPRRGVLVRIIDLLTPEEDTQ